MDEHTEDRAEPEEEEMSKLKRLVTEVVIEWTKTLVEKLWNKLTGKPKRLS